MLAGLKFAQNGSLETKYHEEFEKKREQRYKILSSDAVIAKHASLQKWTKEIVSTVYIFEFIQRYHGKSA